MFSRFFLASLLVLGSVSFAAKPAKKPVSVAPVSVASDSTTIDSLYKHGVFLFDHGDPEGARATFMEAAKLDPKNPVFQYELCYCHYVKRDYKGAEPYCRNAVAWFDSAKVNEAPFDVMASLYEINGMLDSASIMFNLGYEKNPKSKIIPHNAEQMMWRQVKKDTVYFDSAFVWGMRAVTNDHQRGRVHYVFASLCFPGSNWMDAFAHYTYTMIIDTSREEKVESANHLIWMARNLDSLKVSSHTVDTAGTMKFVADLKKKMAEKKIEDKNYADTTISIYGSLTEYVIRVSEALGESEAYKGPLKEFYVGAVKAGHHKAYANKIGEMADYGAYARWLFANKAAYQNYAKWFNDDWWKKRR